MRGFYVMKMKKDQRTGHYVGVATWISRNDPLPGSRVTSSNPSNIGRAEQVSSRDGLEEHASPQISDARENEQRGERYQIELTKDIRIEIPEPKANDPSGRKTGRSWYSDDSYEL